MSNLVRDIEGTASERFDVIIVGGGIYGAMLMLEALRAGLRPLLLEKSDFGASTSFNNLRIVHGGLRYLQSLHLSRYFESVAERRWFLTTFPEFVQPLPCLMPLYGGLMRSRPVFGAALLLNELLSIRRNANVNPDRRLPPGRLLSVADTRRHFPLVRTDGLIGGALWYDAVMPDCHRVQIEVMRWAASEGGAALNYLEVDGLLTTDGNVSGVIATDCITDSKLEFTAPVVINAAGPAVEDVANRFGQPQTGLFKPSLAWNLVLDRPPLSEGAVAVQAPEKQSRVFFIHSLHGRLMVGTGHSPSRKDHAASVSHDMVNSMIDDINHAVPGLNLKTDEIIRILDGQLPVKQAGTVNLLDVPNIIDHGSRGGPTGLFSLCGVKYTTARSTAEKLVKMILTSLSGRISAKRRALSTRPEANPFDLDTPEMQEHQTQFRCLQRLVASEAPQTLADLLLRRANLASNPQKAMGMAEMACRAFGWEKERHAQEISQLENDLDNARSTSEDGEPARIVA
jgi:glycerol-3-phosphate dehydrogenase